MSKLLMRRTTVIEKFAATFTGKELLGFINQELAAQGETRIPPDAKLFVSVPGGADWSNTDLDLNDYPLQITWTTEETE